MSIILSTVIATCPHCGHQASQIDTDKKHAIKVVSAAMQRHITDEHPEELL